MAVDAQQKGSTPPQHSAEEIRAQIEAGFKEFATGNFYTEEEMVRDFGQYGWGKHPSSEANTK
jgi:hypothetical protein